MHSICTVHAHIQSLLLKNISWIVWGCDENYQKGMFECPWLEMHVERKPKKNEMQREIFVYRQMIDNCTFCHEFNWHRRKLEQSDILFRGRIDILKRQFTELINFDISEKYSITFIVILKQRSSLLMQLKKSRMTEPIELFYLKQLC